MMTSTGMGALSASLVGMAIFADLPALVGWALLISGVLLWSFGVVQERSKEGKRHE
jgi:hypothetical protein